MPLPLFNLPNQFLLSLATAILIALFPVETYAEDLFMIQSEHTEITVLSMDSYFWQHEISGQNQTADDYRMTISIPETAELESISLEVTINGKTKKVQRDQFLTKSTVDWSAFFTGEQKYRVLIPMKCTFQLKYHTTNQHTIFLSRFFKHGFFDAKYATTRVHLPENLQITTQLNKIYSGDDMVFDSLDFAQSKETLYFIVHPKGTTPEGYFSNWFSEKIEPLSVPDLQLVSANMETLSESTDRTELAKACFSYVQQNIRYVDIENGIHAIVPRASKMTMANKYGDCKDMAIVLYGLLKHYQFETYLSVSRTFMKKDTFDFPSIGMANHMIVSLKLNNEWYFLDPTEDECRFGDPSIQILGTEVFQIGNTGSYFHSVPSQPRFTPEANLTYRFSKNAAGTIDLKIFLYTKGKLNQNFIYFKQQQENHEKDLRDYLNHLFPNKPTLDNYIISDTSSNLELTMQLPPNSCNQIGSNFYIDLNQLPDIQKLSLFLSGMETPRFNSNYTITLQGITGPNIAPEEAITYNNTLPGMITINYTITEESAKIDSKPNLFWKKLCSKPLKFIP